MKHEERGGEKGGGEGRGERSQSNIYFTSIQ